MSLNGKYIDIEEVNSEDFRNISENKRHGEFLDAIKPFLDLLNKNNKSTEDLIGYIKQIESPEVNIVSHHKPVVDAIVKMGNGINEHLKGLRPVENKDAELIVEAIKNIKPPPEVNITNDYKEVVQAIKKMGDDITNGHDEILKNQDAIIEQLKILNIPKNYKHKVIRDHGYIDYVLTTSEPVINKPKI